MTTTGTPAPKHWIINEWNTDQGLMQSKTNAEIVVEFTVNEYGRITVTHHHHYSVKITPSATDEFFALGKQWWHQFYGEDNPS